jgi:hypothetical protein
MRTPAAHIQQASLGPRTTTTKSKGPIRGEGDQVKFHAMTSRIGPLERMPSLGDPPSDRARRSTTEERASVIQVNVRGTSFGRPYMSPCRGTCGLFDAPKSKAAGTLHSRRIPRAHTDSPSTRILCKTAPALSYEQTAIVRAGVIARDRVAHRRDPSAQVSAVSSEH